HAGLVRREALPGITTDMGLRAGVTACRRPVLSCALAVWWMHGTEPPRCGSVPASGRADADGQRHGGRAVSRPLLLLAQLPAGGIDVAAAGLADMGVDAGGAQNFLEAHYILAARPLIRQGFNFVVANEIHIRPHCLAEPRKLAGMLGAVVHVMQQDVLEGDLAPGAVKVVTAGIEDLRQREVLGPGDELPPQRLV